MKNILLLLAIALLATACSKGPATKAKFAVTIGGLEANGNDITQIVITGQSDSGKRFSRVLTSGTDSINLELPNEAWNFLAMAWEGADLDGKVRCAVSREKLDGQEVNVSLVLTNAKCFDGTLNQNASEVFNGNPSFKDTQWRACRTDLSTIATAGESCIHDMSVLESKGAIIGSMEVAIVGGFKLGKGFVPNGEKMASTCATIANMGTISARYPAVNSNYFFPLVAIGFAGTSCDPNSGFSASFLSDQKIKALNDTPMVSMFAQFTDVDVCGMKNFTTIDAVGAGTATSPHALCNLDQLKHWQENFITHSGKPVALMADLDLLPWIKAGLSGLTPFKLCINEGSTFIPLGMGTNAACAETTSTGYSGNFHGHGYRIKHMRMDHENSNNVGFFRLLSAGSNIAHIRFTKPFVRGADNVGVVFGDGTSGGNATKDIKISDGEVEGNDYVGMVAGTMPPALAGISSFHASGKVEGETYVGGIAGVADHLEEVSFSGQVTSDSGNSVGGIAGSADNINKAIQSGLVQGLDRVGGIAGVIFTSIQDVRVNGAILATLDSGAGNLHGGVIGTATGASVTRAAFLGSLYSYNNSGGGVGAIAGDNPSQTDTYTIQSIVRGGGTNGLSVGASSKASAMWTKLCDFGGTPWICGDADTDLVLDAGEGADLPRLAFENHTCSLPDNLATVAVQSGTRGSAQNPIIICDKQQLAEIGSNASLHYRLEQDISLAFGGFVDITSTFFAGGFDGNGHALHGYINDSLTSSYGLFSAIASSAVVKNLDLANFHLKSTLGNISILGTNSGTLENIRAVASSLESDAKTVSAIAHVNAGTMTKIYADVSVTGLGEVGGVVGSNTGTMTDIFSESSVSGNGTASSAGADKGFGGVVGLNSGLISLATFKGELSISGTPWDPSEIGGLVGFNDGGITDSDVTKDARIDIQNVTATKAGALIGNVDASSGTIARLISNSPLKSTNASAYATNLFGTTFGDYGPGGGAPVSVVSYVPLLEYSGYTTSAPNFTWNGTTSCVSGTTATSLVLTNNTSYFNIPSDGGDAPNLNMTFLTGPNRFQFPGTSAAECNEYDLNLDIFTAHLAANGLTVAQLKTAGFNIGDLENGTAAEKNLFFKAYVDYIKGLTPTPPLWVYEEGRYELFRLEDK